MKLNFKTLLSIALFATSASIMPKLSALHGSVAATPAIGPICKSYRDGQGPDLTGMPDIFDAAMRNDIQRVQQDFGDDPECLNITNSEGLSALHIASDAGATETAEFLIMMGANVDLRSKDGSTPLHFAAQSRNLGVVRLLVINGRAKINTEDNAGHTPLTIACSNKVRRFLREHGGIDPLENPTATMNATPAKIIHAHAPDPRWFLEGDELSEKSNS